MSSALAEPLHLGWFCWAECLLFCETVVFELAQVLKYKDKDTQPVQIHSKLNTQVVPCQNFTKIFASLNGILQKRTTQKQFVKNDFR